MAARFLATEPTAVRRVLAAHRRDDRCANCTPAIAWPCTLPVIANRAVGHTTPDLISLDHLPRIDAARAVPLSMAGAPHEQGDP